MPESAPISVLYVDDEQEMLDITKIFLERTGDFSVRTTLSVADAFEILRTGKTDAIISDYQMPEMDGIEFLKKVRSHDPGIPFILFTGRGREEVVIQAINNGASSYLQKGGDVTAQFTELAHKIRESVARAQAEDALQKNFFALQQQEQVIREREKYYRAVFENTGTAMIVIDEDTTISLVNGEGERLSGYPRADVEGKMRWTDFVPREHHEKMLAWHRLRREDSTKAPRTYEFPMIDRSGTIRTIHLTIDIIPGTKKSVASLMDITERVRMEDTLRRSEMLHRTIFETSPDAIALINAEGIITYTSPSAIRMFGLESEKDAVGTPLFDWIAPEMRNKVTNRVLQFIRSNAPSSSTSLFTLQKKDGTRFYAEISSSVMSDAESKPAGMLSILRDVTDRTKIENALRDASTKLNLLASVTRHDILNKLTVLLGYIELARRASDPEVVEDFLKKIDEIAVMLEEQILFTKDYQDLGVNSPTWQGISASISRASSELEPGQVRIVDECGSLEIFADPLLVKVVYNLIDNALRHGGSVSTIRIRYQNADRDLTWIIEDDGDGVQVKDKENIFSKGFGKNTGFGLFLVREILAITGMSIAETGFPGNGARFGIHVPYGHYRFADKL